MEVPGGERRNRLSSLLEAACVDVVICRGGARGGCPDGVDRGSRLRAGAQLGRQPCATMVAGPRRSALARCSAWMKPSLGQEHAASGSVKCAAPWDRALLRADEERVVPKRLRFSAWRFSAAARSASAFAAAAAAATASSACEDSRILVKRFVRHRSSRGICGGARRLAPRRRSSDARRQLRGFKPALHFGARSSVARA